MADSFGSMNTMKRIKVNNDANNIGVVALFISGIALLAFCIWIIYTDGFDAEIIEGLVISLLVVFAFLKFFSSKSKDEYVSELLVSKTALTLIYTYKNKKRQVVINKKDIIQVKADFNYSKTKVEIFKNNGEIITFEDYLGKSVSFCYHKFLLDLISISEDLPNFTYEFFTTHDMVEADIKYFQQYRKRLTLFKKIQKRFNEASNFSKIFWVIIVGVWLIFMLIIVFPLFLGMY